MSLSPQQFEQLPMFVTARHVRENFEHMDLPYAAKSAAEKPTLDMLYARKIEDFEKTPEYYNWDPRSVRNEGVRVPIKVSLTNGTPQLTDGHHRVALQHEADPDRLIPVEYDSAEARRYRTRRAQDDPMEKPRKLGYPEL